MSLNFAFLNGVEEVRHSCLKRFLLRMPCRGAFRDCFDGTTLKIPQCHKSGCVSVAGHQKEKGLRNFWRQGCLCFNFWQCGQEDHDAPFARSSRQTGMDIENGCMESRLSQPAASTVCGFPLEAFQSRLLVAIVCSRHQNRVLQSLCLARHL